MNLLNIGRYLFVLPFAVFGLLHFGPLEYSIGYVPDFLPAKAFWVYCSGACLIAFTLSALIRRLDQLAACLLALMLLLFVFLVHIPGAIQGDFVQFIGIFRDTAMAGAALIYSELLAKDRNFQRSKTIR